MIRRFQAVYGFFITLPNRLYPFALEIEGKRVRGRIAYEEALARIRAIKGPDNYGYTILMYRQLFHFLGAVFFILLATFLAHAFFHGEAALLVLMVAAILAITYQEFYLHPRYYRQHLPKSVSDWLTWVVPISIYTVSLL
ncbi:MAG TPA: hypothetical protein VNU47_02620 [Candidatus Paceibacterota bacterium]|nr:hypothetical protein [Candidatus Paceibacterota bacterium]